MPTYLGHLAFSDDVHTSVAFIRQNPSYGGLVPDTMATGDIVASKAVSCLILRRRRDVPVIQGLNDLLCSQPLLSQRENQLYSFGGFLIWLHSAIFTFSVTIRTDFTLVFTPSKFCEFGASVFY